MERDRKNSNSGDLKQIIFLALLLSTQLAGGQEGQLASWRVIQLSSCLGTFCLGAGCLGSWPGRLPGSLGSQLVIGTGQPKDLAAWLPKSLQNYDCMETPFFVRRFLTSSTNCFDPGSNNNKQCIKEVWVFLKKQKKTTTKKPPKTFAQDITIS